MVYTWIDYIQQFLFPSHCRLCLGPATGRLSLCVGCRDELPWLTGTCNRCALPMAADAGHETCPACRSSPPQLDSCRALFAYLPPVDRWIHALKFDRDLALARLLGLLLAEQLAQPVGTERILAVPLHPRRLRQRGFNQATEIIRPLLRRGWQPSRCGCYRKRHTEAQSALHASQRRGNLRNAFAIHKPLRGDHILLIDDVMTTGSTLNELARTLKAAGAERVDAWVIARALKAH